MFHHNRLMVGQPSHRHNLPLQIPKGKPGRRLVQPQGFQFFQKRALPIGFLEGVEDTPKGFPCALVPPFQLPFPEGKPGAFHCRRSHRYGILANIQYPPGERAQDEPVAPAGLIDKFLIHLPQLHAFLGPYRIQPFIRDRPSC